MISVGAGLGRAAEGWVFLHFLADGGGVANTEERELGIVRFLVERRRACACVHILGDFRGVGLSSTLRFCQVIVYILPGIAMEKTLVKVRCYLKQIQIFLCILTENTNYSSST